MSKIRIVADSSADLLTMDGMDFVSVPLKIMAGSNTWVDDGDLDVHGMLDTLATYRGKSTSSCPSPQDYLNAFGDAEEIVCVPISQNMSGSYNSCCVAANDYMEQHPGRKVHVIDTLLASAPMTLICEKLADMIRQGLPFDTIVERIDAETRRTRLLFCLQSVRSLANNGRLPQTVAALVGILNIRLIARASVRGEAEMLGKARGEKKAAMALVEQMKKLGFDGGRVIIHTARNNAFAQMVADGIRQVWEKADITIGECRGLCSFYGEDGGLLMGLQVN